MTTRQQIRAIRRAHRESEAGQRCVSLPTTRERADVGYGWLGEPMQYRRSVLVTATGSVLVWDEVAGAYTGCHDLTEEEQAQARRLAAGEEAS